jgi:hypothetical protein
MVFWTAVYHFFSRRWVYHTLFWLALIPLMLLLPSQQEVGWLMRWLAFMVNGLLYGLIVYFNLLYLIPRYLSGKRFARYSLLLILSVLLLTPIRVFILFILMEGYPEVQADLKVSQVWYFLITFFVVGMSTVMKVFSEWVRYQRDRQELVTKNMQSELKFLKSQINPHFLFNTLNSLYALTIKKDDRAPEIVIKLSEMLRYMLYESNAARVSLEKEINYIKNYLELEQLRQGGEADIQFHLKGEVNHQSIAPLMFIPFLENAFKHGLNHQMGKGFVHATLEVQDQKVHLLIENSKPEHIPLQPQKSGGIGMVNVRRRLDLIYPDRHRLLVENNPKTYKVDMRLELDTPAELAGI